MTEQSTAPPKARTIEVLNLISGILIGVLAAVVAMLPDRTAQDAVAHAIGKDVRQSYANLYEIIEKNPDLENRLSLLKRFRNDIGYLAELKNESAKKFVADVDRAIADTEALIAQRAADAAAERRIAEELAQQAVLAAAAQTKTDEAEAQALLVAIETEQRRIEEERLTREAELLQQKELLRLQNLEQQRMLAEERICFDDLCRDWIIP